MSGLDTPFGATSHTWCNRTAPLPTYQVFALQRRERDGKQYFVEAMNRRVGPRFKEVSFDIYFGLLLGLSDTGRFTLTLTDERYATHNRFGGIATRPRGARGRHQAFGDQEILLVQYDGKSQFIVVPDDCIDMPLEEILHPERVM